jgi:hypothetical protein
VISSRLSKIRVSKHPKQTWFLSFNNLFIYHFVKVSMRIKNKIVIAWVVFGVCLVLLGRFPGILWFIVFAIIIWGIPSKPGNSSKDDGPKYTNDKTLNVTPVGFMIPPKLPAVGGVFLPPSSRPSQNRRGDSDHEASTGGH